MTTGCFNSPWPAEDGGPERLQNIDSPAGQSLALRASRRVLMHTMTVLGDEGEVFLLRHSALRSRFGLPTTARVERIDPLTLQPIACSPRLPGGPMWPGGMAVHRNGDLYVVYGRFVHRLERAGCQVLGRLQLPVNEPHNSFVILDDGVLVMKNLSDSTPAMFTVIKADSMTFAASPLNAPEPSIARLSARGNTVYLVGTRSIMRFDWDGKALRQDSGWRHDYVGDSGRSHGWDVVLGQRHAWFMDNGRHRYRRHMIGRGVGQATNRLIRIALDEAEDVDAIEISGKPGGAITNPPLWDEVRQIVVAYDSANRFMHAFRFEESSRKLESLWTIPDIGCASHMLLYARSGLLITNDFQGREAVVAIDITNGAIKSRAETGGFMQGVVFPAPGWNGDLYWGAMDRVSRMEWVTESANSKGGEHARTR